MQWLHLHRSSKLRAVFRWCRWTRGISHMNGFNTRPDVVLRWHIIDFAGPCDRYKSTRSKSIVRKNFTIKQVWTSRHVFPPPPHPHPPLPHLTPHTMARFNVFSLGTICCLLNYSFTLLHIVGIKLCPPLIAIVVMRGHGRYLTGPARRRVQTQL